ncbi:MAG: hypothetical protein WA005_08825 [Candidatus Binataceae bacterium]
MDLQRHGIRAAVRRLVVSAVALAFVEDLMKAVPHAVAALAPAWRETLLSDSHRMASSLPAAIAARVDLLGPISLMLFGAAGVCWSITRLGMLVKPVARRYPGLEDRLEGLHLLVKKRIGPPRQSLWVLGKWNSNAKAFIELREGLRRAWTQALPAFSELAVVLNRMSAIIDRLRRNDREIDPRQVALLRETGNRRIAELRAALNCVLDMLGRDQPTFAVSLPHVNEEKRCVAL